jgi:hypothetical protein
MLETTGSKPLLIDPARVAARYTAVWGEPDDRLCRAAITRLWASGGVEFVEGAQFRGHKEIDARITHAHAEFVGSGKYTVAPRATRPATTTSSCSRSNWSPLAMGRSPGRRVSSCSSTKKASSERTTS